MPFSESEFQQFRVRYGDVLLNEGQSLQLVGRCSMFRDELPVPCAIQNQLLRFRAKEHTDAAFAEQLFRYCQASGIFSAIATQTTSIAHLGQTRFSRLYLQWPLDIREQKAIAEALGEMDASIGALEQLIAKKRDLKQAATQQLITGKTRLPGFKETWRPTRLGEIGGFTKGRGILKDQLVADGVCCVRYGEIYTRHSDYIRQFFSFIPRKVADQSQRLRKGHLLFAGSGETAEEIGKCTAFLADDEAYAGGDIVLFMPQGQDSRYLGYLMNYASVANQKARMGQGDAVVHISAGNLAQLELTLPPLNEQSAIASVISQMDADLIALEQRRDKTRALKQGMMHELLTGKTRLV